MNTTNIVSTPNIEGNIGSCTTKNEQVILKEGIFTKVGVNYTTNSCTGKTVKSEYTQIQGSSIIGVILLVIGLVGLVSSFFTKSK